MSNHPNFDRAQAVLDAVRQGDYAPVFDLYADDIQMENGPGAGPWHLARGKDDMALMLTEFAGFFGDTLNQDGRCVYADDHTAICLIHETGTAPGGDQFDNLAVYTLRLRPDGQADRVWTVDLDAENCEPSGRRTLAHPQRLLPGVAAYLGLPPVRESDRKAEARRLPVAGSPTSEPAQRCRPELRLSRNGRGKRRSRMRQKVVAMNLSQAAIFRPFQIPPE